MSNSYNWSHRKLTDEQAAEVRQLYAAGGISQRELAERFGCGPSTIQGIIDNRNYLTPVGVLNKKKKKKESKNAQVQTP